jgi:hypothetical protein
MRRSAALALPLLALLAPPAAAGPLVPTRASQVVALNPTPVTDSGCGASAYPVDNMRTSDGQLVPFTIPLNQVFVVTSMDVFGQADEPNRRYFFALFIDTSPSVPGGSLVVGDAGLTDASGNYSGSVTVPTGVVVPPGVLLCAQIDGPAEEPTFTRVHGFFAKDK